MPYDLRKSPQKNAYWVVNRESGKKYSRLPIPLSRAEAQRRALYAVDSGYVLSRNRSRTRRFSAGESCGTLYKGSYRQNRSLSGGGRKKTRKSVFRSRRSRSRSKKTVLSKSVIPRYLKRYTEYVANEE
jgi:hypothetical protein